MHYFLDENPSKTLQRGFYPLPIIAEFFFKMMVFFCVFDGIRSFMVFGADQLTYGKELSVFSLLLLLMVKKPGFSLQKIIYSNLIYSVYLLFIGTIIIFFNGYTRAMTVEFTSSSYPSGAAMHFKNIESGLAFFVLLNYTHLTNRPIKALLRYFVKLCVIYVMLTILCYTVLDLSFIFQKHWIDRISLGYPTSDAEILCFGLAYVIFSKGEFKSRSKYLYVTIIIVGILISATETGFLSIFVILFLYIFYYILTNGIKKVFTFKKVLITFCIVGALSILSSYEIAIPSEFQVYINLFSNKLKSATNKLTGKFDNEDSGIDNGSSQIRKLEASRAFSAKDDMISIIIGGPVELGSIIESENYFLVRSYGVVGFIIYYSWFLSLIIFVLRKIKNNSRFILLVGLAFVFMSNISLITTYVFGITICIGMFACNALDD